MSLDHWGSGDEEAQAGETPFGPPLGKPGLPETVTSCCVVSGDYIYNSECRACTISRGAASQDPFLTSQPLSLSSLTDAADLRRQGFDVSQRLCGPHILQFLFWEGSSFTVQFKIRFDARVLDPSSSSNTTEYSEQAAEFV